MNESSSPREERAADNAAGSRFYDRNGNPISLEGWAFLFEKDDHQIRRDTIGDVTVSTVWLGLNHAFPPIDDKIQIFETMIFGGDFERDMWRYATEDEAVAGHERITREIKAGLNPGA